jgi:hypothetical protein
MRKGPKVDPSQTHFAVLGLDENATIVKRQVREAYERRAPECVQRLAKIDAGSAEASALRARLAQLNAAKAVLLPRALRDGYKARVQQLRDAQRELEEETSRGTDRKGGQEGSAVLLLHLRQQVERSLEDLRKLHEQQYERHAHDHEGGPRADDDDESEEEFEDDEVRRRTAPAGRKAAALAQLAAQRPVKRF